MRYHHVCGDIPYLSHELLKQLSHTYHETSPKKTAWKNHTFYFRIITMKYYLLISWSIDFIHESGDFLWWMVIFTVNFHDFMTFIPGGAVDRANVVANDQELPEMKVARKKLVMNQLVGGTPVYFVWLPGNSYVFICLCQRIENRARKTGVFENVLVRY